MKKRKLKRFYKKYAKVVIILAAVAVVSWVLGHRDIKAVNNITDENVYVVADAITSGTMQYTVKCPDTVTNLEEAVEYEHELYRQAIKMTDVYMITAAFTTPFEAYYDDGYMTIIMLGTSEKELDELYDRETENVKKLAGEEFDSLSDREKIALIIKYVADTYRYGKKEDGTRYDIKTSIEESHTVVCSGYSIIVAAICKRLDIDCVIVSSGKHSWNAVRLDDNEYYTVVDLTNWKFGYTGSLLYYIRSLVGDYNIDYCEVVTRPAGCREIIGQVITNVKYELNK